MLRRFSYYSLARVAITGAQLAFVPIAVVQVGADGFGIFNLLLQLALLFRLLTVQAVNQVILRDYSSLSTEFGELGLYRQGLRYFFIVGIPVAITLTLFASQIAPTFRLEPQHIWLAVIMGAAFSIFSIKHALLYCRDFRRYTLWEIGQSIGVTVAMVGLAALIPTVESYAFSFILITTVIATVMIWFGIAPAPQSGGSRSIARDVWSYGAPLALADGLGWAINVADRFQIAQMLDPAQTGIYVAAFQLFVAPMSIVTMVLITVLQPVIFGSDRAEYRRRMEQTVAVLGVCSLLYVLLLGMVGPMLFGLFFRHQAEVDRSLVVILALAGVANAYVQLQILAGKYARGAPRVLKIQAVAVVLLLVGNWLLLPRLGIMAAAITSLLACAIQVVMLRIAARAEERFSLFRFSALLTAWTQVTRRVIRSAE